MMNNSTKGDREGLDRLRELSSKIRRAVNNDKDLNSEKYQRYYQNCITIKDSLEKEALDLLDSGHAKQFDEIADAIHAASAVVEEFKAKLRRINGPPKETHNVSRNNVKELGNWASFSDHDDGWTKVTKDHANIGKKVGLKSATPTRMNDGQEYWDVAKVGRGVAGNAGITHKQKVGKHSNAPGKMPKKSTMSTSISLSHGSDERDSMEEVAIHNNNRDSDDSGHIYQTSKTFNKSRKPMVTDRSVDNLENKEHRYDNNRAIDYKQRNKKNEVTKIDDTGTQDEFIEGVDDFKKRNHRIHGDHKWLDATKSRPKVDGTKIETIPISDNRNVEPALLIEYGEILEKCLVLLDSHKLAHRLVGKALEEKIAVCRKFLKTHNVEYVVDTEHDPSIIQALKEGNDLSSKVASLKVRNEFIEESPAEPLWRVKDDGGVSTYIGRYLTKGGTLFDGILFTVHLDLARIEGSSEVEVRVEVSRKMHGVEINIALRGDGSETVRIIKRSAMMFTFRCNPDIWSYGLPSLLVEIVESDGTKRGLMIQMPIGPSTFSEPLELEQKKIERIMKNNRDMGYYTMQRAFTPKSKLELSTLLASLSSYFSIRKTNTKHTLAAVYSNDQIVVATLHSEGEIIIMNSWSSSEKLVASACNHIKEVAAYLSAEMDTKLADLAMRSCNAFPIEFEKDHHAPHKKIASELSADSNSVHVSSWRNKVRNATITRHAQDFSGI